MNDDPYRACPMCRSKLSELMKYKDDENRKWKVYECKNCGSEIWIDPFKKLREWFSKHRYL